MIGPEFLAVPQIRQELSSKCLAYPIIDRGTLPAPLDQSRFVQDFQVLAGHGLGEPHMFLDRGDGFFRSLYEEQYPESRRMTQDLQQAGSSVQGSCRLRRGISLFHVKIYYAD